MASFDSIQIRTGEVTERLAVVALQGSHQYALTWGAQNFREALAKKQGYEKMQKRGKR